ncbi:MAG TPA: glycosyltransferase family 1 protein [Candidatus Angelobacter sp.]|nr:glycosyltransferase family 1 protein [Candidatus Angelobacter sp.]
MNRADTSHKPTVAFDTWALGGFARNHGISVYARKLLTYFRETGPECPVEIMPYVCTGADNDANQFEAAPGFRPQQTRLLHHSRLWRWGGANLVVALGKADLVFSPTCTTLYGGLAVRSVVTIHDLIPVVLPWGSRRITQALRLSLWWSAKYSQEIITVSQHSKSDIVNTYGLLESRITVIHDGYDKARFNTCRPDPDLRGKLLSKLGIDRPYVLHHGVIKPNKNLKRLIQAYRLALERNRNLDVDLVLAGPLGWEYEDVLREAAKIPEGRGRVIFTHPLSDDDLAVLVKGARLAVVPSLYEGFCIPMIESMACGVPTIAANSSCLPEISGNLLKYFDPRSVDEMAVCIDQAVEDETLRNDLVVKGLLRADDFGWERCARETMAVLARVAVEGKR